MVADAFVAQMSAEAEGLRQSKAQLESDLASGQDLQASRERLEKANENYRTASLPLRKHLSKPKAKSAAGKGQGDGTPAPTA